MALSKTSSPVLIRCKGILFDMDGILISSLGSVERSWTKWALMRGVDPAYACRIAHGCRAIETVAKLRPDLDSEAELRVVEEIEIADGEGLSVLPGVMDLLASLPAERWTVVTSATERLARERLAACGIPVPARIITAESVTQGKPNPAPFLAGAALLGFPPEECVVVEDAPSGVGAGKAAGCRVLGVLGTHSRNELRAANWVIASLEGLVVMADSDGLELRFLPVV